MLRDTGQRRRRVEETADPGRIVRGADDHEVVVHQTAPRLAVARCHELLLRPRRVGEHGIGVAARAEAQRFAGAHRDDPHAVLRVRAPEGGQDRFEEAGVLGGRGGGEDDLAGACGAGFDYE